MVVQFDFRAFEILKFVDRSQTISAGFAVVTDYNDRENIILRCLRQCNFVFVLNHNRKEAEF